jgi:hypothetical protein
MPVLADMLLAIASFHVNTRQEMFTRRNAAIDDKRYRCINTTFAFPTTNCSLTDDKLSKQSDALFMLICILTRPTIVVQLSNIFFAC